MHGVPRVHVRGQGARGAGGSGELPTSVASDSELVSSLCWNLMESPLLGGFGLPEVPPLEGRGEWAGPEPGSK